MRSEAHTYRKTGSPGSTSEDAVMQANVESDVREDEPARSGARVCEPAAARTDGAEASASTLYATWKQKVLAGSPAKSLEGEAKTSPKRARGSSRERRAPESGSSSARSLCSCSSDEHSTCDSIRRRLAPMPVEPHIGAMRGRGGGKSKGGGKGRGKGRGKSRHR